MYKYRVPAYPPTQFQGNPYIFNRNYGRKTYGNNHKMNQYEPKPKSSKDDEKQDAENTRNSSFGLNNLFQINQDEVLFEIFGLKIYFDDLLIICILLFLYQEGINDKYLFISLILLLLS